MKISEITDNDTTFQCYICEQTFDKGRPSEDAIKEELARRENGFYDRLGLVPEGISLDEVDVICDECGKEFFAYIESYKESDH